MDRLEEIKRAMDRDYGARQITAAQIRWLLDEIQRLRAIVACPVCGEESANVLPGGCNDCMVELIGGC